MDTNQKIEQRICICECDCRRGMTRRAMVCDACKYGIHRKFFKDPDAPRLSVDAAPIRWIEELALEQAYQQRADLYGQYRAN